MVHCSFDSYHVTNCQRLVVNLSIENKFLVGFCKQITSALYFFTIKYYGQWVVLGMPRCAAVNCKNMGTHTFPKDVERRRMWAKALRRINWKPSKSARLCAIHFKPEDYFEKNSYTGKAFFHKTEIVVYNKHLRCVNR